MRAVNHNASRFAEWISFHTNELRRGDFSFVDRHQGRYKDELDRVLMGFFGETSTSFAESVCPGRYCDRNALEVRVKAIEDESLEAGMKAYRELSDDEREFVDRYTGQFLNRSLWNFMER